MTFSGGKELSTAMALFIIIKIEKSHTVTSELQDKTKDQNTKLKRIYVRTYIILFEVESHPLYYECKEVGVSSSQNIQSNHLTTWDTWVPTQTD